MTLKVSRKGNLTNGNVAAISSPSSYQNRSLGIVQTGQHPGPMCLVILLTRKVKHTLNEC